MSNTTIPQNLPAQANQTQNSGNVDNRTAQKGPDLSDASSHELGAARAMLATGRGNALEDPAVRAMLLAYKDAIARNG